jgi:RNA polymerase sigma factor (sigma-70 family)
MDPRAAPLLQRLDEFTAFARKRLRDEHLAADAVQDALARALDRIGQLADDERVDAWFYRILRNIIADLHRARAARPADAAIAEEPAAEAEDRREACACVVRLIADLPPAYAAALRRVDLDGASMDDAAAAEGISVANLKVRRHRAREALRELVHATCTVCAAHGCIDCHCGHPEAR